MKRGDNSEVRRRVVGQMLDYAAHAADSWSAEGVRKRFESEAGSESAAREQLAARLGVGSGMADGAGAYEAFWMRVSTNLRDENLRLLFVADHIPDVLASIVEFLNRHMGRIEVLAVELKQFQAQGTRAIVPRVIGRSRKLLSSGMGSRLTLEQIIEGFAEGEVRGCGAPTHRPLARCRREFRARIARHEHSRPVPALGPARHRSLVVPVRSRLDADEALHVRCRDSRLRSPAPGGSS